MKLAIATTLLSAMLCVSAFAEDQSSLVKKGAKPLTGPEKAQLFPGKTMKGTSYDQAGKKVATWSVTYTKGGQKILKLGGKTIERKWWVDGSKFCEQLANSGKTTCENGPYKLASKCYTFHSNGSIQNEMSC
ncbi:hypothetical protein [Microbaculum sp. FT89]|uniref:hypothetical protein n=1 Tax=Microbaculum sp. FT89 TaxID=3447298 RepID=UPI003F53D36D